MLIGRERDLSLLSLVCRANTDNIADRIPECPVSLLIFVSLDQLWICRFVSRGSEDSLKCSSVSRDTLSVETAGPECRSVLQFIINIS